MIPTQRESSSPSSTAFRHGPWESLDLFGRIYAGAVTTTLGFLAHWAYTTGDPTAAGVMVGCWVAALCLLRVSTSYQEPKPEPAGELVGPGLFDDIADRPHPCRHRSARGHRRPTTHQPPTPNYPRNRP